MADTEVPNYVLPERSIEDEQREAKKEYDRQEKRVLKIAKEEKRIVDDLEGTISIENLQVDGDGNILLPEGHSVASLSIEQADEIVAAEAEIKSLRAGQQK